MLATHPAASEASADSPAAAGMSFDEARALSPGYVTYEVIFNQFSVGAPSGGFEPRTPVICRCTPRGVAGLHVVRFERAGERFTDHGFLDREDDLRALLVKAVDRLRAPLENLRTLYDEMAARLDEQWAYYRHGLSHVLVEPLDQAAVWDLQWLWPDRIAADKLTMLVGDPGIGKSLLALDIAARVTTGRRWPDESADAERRNPGGVLIFSELDDPDDTLRPRLQALGADLSRVSLVRSFKRGCDDGEPDVLPFSIAGTFDMLSDCVDKVDNCKLVIIDPLSTYIDANYARRDLADLMQQLVELAANNSIAILVVSHYSRGSHALFNYGSQANSRFVASARSVWKIVGDRAYHDRRFLLPLKNNLGTDWRGLAFRIQCTPGDPAPRIVWESDPLAIKVDRETLRPEPPRALPNSYAVHRRMIQQWLHEQLADGERFAQDILAAATVARIGEKSLRKALREIGGTSRRGSSGLWVWQLLDQSSNALWLESENTPSLPCKSACQVDQVDQAGQVDQPP